MSGRPRALSGRNTGNSVPGGVFAKAPEPEVRHSLDGIAGGRWNSSSVAGGIFVGEKVQQRTVPQDRPSYHMNSSIPGGIFGGGQPHQRPAPTGPPDPGPILGGGGGGNARWGGGGSTPAAGGKSSNASHMWNHRRGGSAKPQQPAHDSVEGAFAHFLTTGTAQPRESGSDFLSQLEEAEQRDHEDSGYLTQLLELEQQHELIEAAAAQLAHEQGLGPQAEEELRVKMLARVVAQARQLREQMAGSQQGGPPRPGLGTLDGILSRSSPRDAAGAFAQELPNPTRGRGTFNPASGGADSMTTLLDGGGYAIGGYPTGGGGGGAAGQSSSANASQQREMRLEHRLAHPNAHDHNASKVSFGGNARILYPHSDVMYRGKPPGY